MGNLDKAQLISFLVSHKPEMHERFGIVKIGLFGSFVRGDQRDNSDVDIAVEIVGDKISDKYFGALHFLEDNLHRKIDLGMVSSIRPEILQYIMKEIEYV